MSAESAAKSFWLSAMRQPLIALSNLADAARVLEPYTPDELDLANQALQGLLDDRGLAATDLDTLVAQFDELKANNLEFWAGNYLLQDESGALFTLSILNGTVALTALHDASMLLNVPYDQVSFSSQHLTYNGADLRVDLQLYFASDLPANATVPPHEMAPRDVTGVSGTIQSKGTAPVTRQVKGKRNACTRDGLAYDRHGDPPQVWAGAYVVQYIDDDFSYLDDLTISVGADGTVGMQLGDMAATQVVLVDNTACCALSTGAQIAVQLFCTSGGVRTFTGVAAAAGLSRRVVGTARELHGPSSERFAVKERSPRGATAEGFCATNLDQAIALLSLGTPATPASPFPSLPITYADGSAGTIEVTPVRKGDTWSVPPGSLVAYRLLDDQRRPRTDNDALRVGWQINRSVDLLSMAEADYYQLRVSIGDWSHFDAQGIDISLAEDDQATPGFISLTASPSGGCASGTPGAQSAVKDLSKATVLVAGTGEVAGNARLTYRFALSGKSTSSDNTAGDHDGFLCAALSFKATDGTQKLPPKTVRIPMLLSVVLPISIRQKLVVDGLATLPKAFIGKQYKGTLSARGGAQPYVWQTVGPCPAGLAWAESVDGANLSYTLSGTPGNVTPGQVASLSITVQSDPHTAVSRMQSLSPALMIDAPPAPTVDYAKWGWIAGGTLVGGLIMAGLAKLLFSPKKEEKLNDEQKAKVGKVVTSDVGRAVGAMAGKPVVTVAGDLNRDIVKQPANDLNALRTRTAELQRSAQDMAQRNSNAAAEAERAAKDAAPSEVTKWLEVAQKYKEAVENLDAERGRHEAMEKVSEGAAGLDGE